MEPDEQRLAREEHERNEQRMREEEAIAEKNQIISMITNLCMNIFSRYHYIKDPMVKYTLIVDKCLLLLDVLSAAGMTCSQMKGVTEENKKQISITIGLMRDDLRGLQDWILNPTYSPDHPMGYGLMKDSRLDFANLSIKH